MTKNQIEILKECLRVMKTIEDDGMTYGLRCDLEEIIEEQEKQITENNH